jgi:hypothetical protein
MINITHIEYDKTEQKILLPDGTFLVHIPSDMMEVIDETGHIALYVEKDKDKFIADVGAEQAAPFINKANW